MSDTVKLIVTLSKGQYEALEDMKFGSIASRMIFNAVKHGTPLPTGHGRLIDANKLLEYGSCPNSCGGTVTCMEDYEHLHCPIRVFDIESINDTPTIIEAESEDKE